MDKEQQIIEKVRKFQGANREFSQELPDVIEGLLRLIDEAGPEVVDSLTSNSKTKALSANMGKELKGMVDGKVSAPEAAGTAGQMIQLDENLEPQWVTPSAGSVPDTEMSDESTNAVQNKVIKAYVDAQGVVLDGKIGQLGQENSIIKNKVITRTIDWVGTAPNYLDGRYAINIPSNSVAGDIINLEPIVRVDNIYQIVECSAGDTFIIYIRCNVYRPYAFVDSDNKILDGYGNSGARYNGTTIIAPANAKKLILNATYSEWAELGSKLTIAKSKIDIMQESIDSISESVSGLQTSVGDENSGLIKDVNQLESDVDSLQDDVENINEKLPKEYDKTKTYVTVERNVGLLDFRNFYLTTNISTAPSGCSIDWGDGTPIVSVVNDDSFKHAYEQSGTYVIIISGLTSINYDNFLRELSYIRDVKFANTLSAISSWILNGTTVNSVTFFGTCPALSGSSNSENSFNKVQKIVVPENNLMQYVNGFYNSSSSVSPDAISKKIEPDEEVSYIFKNVEVTVGQDGDYLTIGEAIQFLSKFYPLYKYGGIKAAILILSGTVISEQIFVDGLDLSWITIEYEDYNPESLSYDSVALSIANGTIVFDTTSGYNAVAVDSSGFSGVTHDTRGDVCLFRAENGGKLPIINCVFKLVTPNTSYGVAGIVCNRGSEAVVKTLCGFIGFQDGVISNNESSITIREGITMNCGRWGCHARHNGEVSARSVIATGCATNSTYSSEYGAAVADRVADMDVREAYLSGNVAIRASNASRICAKAAHILGGGVPGVYLVSSDCSSIINASQIEFSSVSGDGIKVEQGGQIDAFSVTGNPTFNTTKNEVTSKGIIFG